MSEDPVFVLNPCLVLWIWHSHSFIWYRLASSNNFPLFPCLSETTTYCPWMSLGNFSCLHVHHLFRCLRREHDDSQATSIVELLLEGESSVIDCLFWKERERRQIFVNNTSQCHTEKNSVSGNSSFRTKGFWETLSLTASTRLFFLWSQAEASSFSSFTLPFFMIKASLFYCCSDLDVKEWKTILSASTVMLFSCPLFVLLHLSLHLSCLVYTVSHHQTLSRVSDNLCILSFQHTIPVVMIFDEGVTWS